MSTDFTMKSQVDPTAIAALAQRQAEAQAQQNQQAQAQKMKMIQDVAQSVGSMVSSSIEASKKRQRDQLDKNLADSFASRVPNRMAPQAGPGLPIAAPEGPVASDNAYQPTQQPLPPVSIPDYAGQNAVRSAVLADPKPWRTLAADMMNPQKNAVEQLNQQKTMLDMQKTQNEISKYNKGTEPASEATKQAISAAYRKAGQPAPDLSNISADRANELFDNAIKLGGDSGKLTLSDRQEQYDEKLMTKLDDRLNYGKSNRGSNGQAAAAIRGIGQLDALFKGYKNDLTPQEWEEASIAWARILSSGGNGAARAQIEALIPKTAVSNVKALQQWLTNDPTGTNQQAFAKRMQKGMARELDVNTNYLKKDTLRALDGYDAVLSRKAPDDLRQFMENKGLSYDEVKAVKPKLAAKAWPDGKPKEEMKMPAKTTKPVDLGNGFSYTVN